MTDPAPLRDVLAANLRRVRSEAGVTQDALASRMSELGFRWVRSTVADVESGRRALQVEELFALPVVLGMELDDLVDPSSWLEAPTPPRWITIGRRGFAIATSAVRAMLRGNWSEHTRGRIGVEALQDRGFVAINADEASVTALAELYSRREGERRLAEVLGVQPIVVARAALELWKRGLSEERDARAATGLDRGDPTAIKGHVTRAMLIEIEAHLVKKRRR